MLVLCWCWISVFAVCFNLVLAVSLFLARFFVRTVFRIRGQRRLLLQLSRERALSSVYHFKREECWLSEDVSVILRWPLSFNECN